MRPQAFKRWRKSLNLSQKEAAKGLGLKRRMIQYYEKGERDGKAVEVPKAVRLACYALSQGIGDYAGLDPETGDPVVTPAGGVKKDKPAKKDKDKKAKKAKKKDKKDKKKARKAKDPDRKVVSITKDIQNKVEAADRTARKAAVKAAETAVRAEILIGAETAKPAAPAKARGRPRKTATSGTATGRVRAAAKTGTRTGRSPTAAPRRGRPPKKPTPQG